MADKKKKSLTKDEQQIKTYNPTKSKAGRIILLILAIGMVAGLVAAMIYGMVNFFQSL
ncbi:MAG: hypothetical protein RBR66_01055 [Candidatus Izemoplasmatales bacterium]|jgi:flagellar basal body-associated protein FliL|nr:hypothetical protein [Candidatus Izemoplasmatales bacterium]